VDGRDEGSFKPSFAAAAGLDPLNSIDVLLCTENVECVGDGVPSPSPGVIGLFGTPRKDVSFFAAVSMSGAGAFTCREDVGIGESGRSEVRDALVVLYVGMQLVSGMMAATMISAGSLF
jgi:hypothetical protein